jgi:hypothetical protein
VVSVTSGVRSLAAGFGADADLVEAAAWLHDIGYTADLATAGLHALYGAATCVTPSTPMPCRAGRSHTNLAPSSRPAKADSPTSFLEFEPTPQALSSVLPDGEPEPVEKRLAEKHHRYGPGHLVVIGRSPRGARSFWSG